MILFFYGEDNYRLKQKIKALKERFISASLGDTNLAVLDGAKVSVDEIMRQVLAMPFLSKSRLVIIENLLSKGKKDVLKNIDEKLGYVPKTTVLVFVEEGLPDKRTRLFKKLNQPGQVQEFKLLDEGQLRRWIFREIENRKSKIEGGAITKLIEYVGNDLWRMTNELDKLTAYSSTSLETGNQQLTTENIELLVNPQIQANIFDLIDSIARQNIEKATKELYKLLNSGENELYILSMIVYQYRNLLIVKDLVERLKTANSWTLAKKAGLHPYVVQKSLAVSPKYTLDELKKIYQILLDFDVRIKTGKIEPRTALEMLIFRLCRK